MLRVSAHAMYIDEAAFASNAVQCLRGHETDSIRGATMKVFVILILTIDVRLVIHRLVVVN